MLFLCACWRNVYIGVGMTYLGGKGLSIWETDILDPSEIEEREHCDIKRP